MTGQEHIERLRTIRALLLAEQSYQINEIWCGSDVQERLIRLLGSTNRLVEWEIHRERLSSRSEIT